MYKKIMILILVAFLFPIVTHAEEISLQKQIDKAQNGDIITIDKEYHENIVIKKPLTLKGTKDGAIIGNKKGTVVFIESDNVTLDSINISGSTRSRSSMQEGACVRNRGSHNVIQNLTLDECYHGIYLNTGDYTVVKNNDIEGYHDGSRGDKGYGMYVKKANKNTIENNYVHVFRDGLYFEYSHNNEITKNEVTETRYGLHYMYSNFNDFTDNKFVGNVGGAAIMHSDNIVLEQNDFSYNQGTQAFGLIVQGSRDITLKNNNFVLNQRGLYIEGSTLTNIEDNMFFNNEIGVELWSSSTEQYFYNNDFVKNRIQATIVGATGQHYFSKHGTGNYWGEPLLDLNQDGFGDEPYMYHSSVGKMLEQNELSYLFLKSPSIFIKNNVERIFADSESGILDEHPLTKKSELSYKNIVAVLLIVIVIGLFYVIRKRVKRA